MQLSRFIKIVRAMKGILKGLLKKVIEDQGNTWVVGGGKTVLGK